MALAPGTMSMGDWLTPVEQTALAAGSRATQLVGPCYQSVYLVRVYLSSTHDLSSVTKGVNLNTAILGSGMQKSSVSTRRNGLGGKGGEEKTSKSNGSSHDDSSTDYTR